MWTDAKLAFCTNYPPDKENAQLDNIDIKTSNIGLLMTDEPMVIKLLAVTIIIIEIVLEVYTNQ